MNFVLSTIDRNKVIVQETIDSDRFLYFVYNPATAKMEARLKSETEEIVFRLDTSEAMNAIAAFMIEHKGERDEAIAKAKAAGTPYPKELESSILIETVLPEVNALARKGLEEMKNELRKNLQIVQKYLAIPGLRCHICNRRDEKHRIGL